MSDVMIIASFYAVGLVVVLALMWRSRPNGAWWFFLPLFVAIWPVLLLSEVEP